MSVENIVQFVVRHNTTLIEVLIGVILVLALLLMIRSFVAAKDEVQSGSSANLGDLEETLKKLLEKANSVPTGLPASADGSDAALLVAEINTLKLELDQKKKEIEDIKTASPAGASADGAAASAPAMSDEDKAKLEAKIKELEGKLSEYEIISEDIADLSFYKEQNTKLQKELEALKAGGTAVAAAAASSAPAAESKPAAEPEIAGKAKATPPPEPEPEVAAAAPEPAPALAEAAPSPPVETAAPVEPTAPPEATPALDSAVVNDDLLAEFAAAIEKQKAGEDQPAAPVAEVAPASEAVSTEAPATEEAAEIDLGALDMDKVIAEASGIQEPEKEVNVEEALGTGVDESKLLEEAAALQNVKPEDEKLMGQFENFVKKGE